MFADLEQIDLIYEDAEGQRIAAQTDHRTTQELVDDAARTVIFTLARIYAPLLDQPAPAQVEYVFQHPPPQPLRDVINAAGASVTGNDDIQPSPAKRDDRMACAALGAAMQHIGQAVLTRHEQPTTLAGLQALERALEPSRDEVVQGPALQRYTAQMELAAAASVVMQAECEGTWHPDPSFQEPFPFALDIDGRRANIFGRAARYYLENADEGPSYLLMALDDDAHSDGLILPVIRYPDTAGLIIGRPLLPKGSAPIDLPSIYLAEDRENSVQYLSCDSDEDFEALLEASMHNLRAAPVEVDFVDGEPALYLVEGFYAPSKALDRGFLTAIAERLHADELWVGMPGRELLFITPADEQWREVFTRFVSKTYQEQLESQKLSAIVVIADPKQGITGWLQPNHLS